MPVKRSKRKKKRKQSVNRVSSFSTPQVCSASLARLLGTSKATRGEATKGIWAYAKSHRLQHPRDGRKIVCDAALSEMFRCQELSFATLSSSLSRHLKPANGQSSSRSSNVGDTASATPAVSVLMVASQELHSFIGRHAPSFSSTCRRRARDGRCLLTAPEAGGVVRRHADARGLARGMSIVVDQTLKSLFPGRSDLARGEVKVLLLLRHLTTTLETELQSGSSSSSGAGGGGGRRECDVQW
jgi:hypothetical protein